MTDVMSEAAYRLKDEALLMWVTNKYPHWTLFMDDWKRAHGERSPFRFLLSRSWPIRALGRLFS